MDKLVFKVSSKEEGKRLDVVGFIHLKEKLPQLSRSMVDKYVDQFFSVNGLWGLKKGYKLKEGDVVSILILELRKKIEEDNVAEDRIVAQQRPLKIIKETKNYMVIDKPKGIPVHPGKGNTQETLANYIKGYLIQKNEYDESLKRAGIVHRLDKGVGGLIIVAKNRKMQIHLQTQFENRKVLKVYLAKVLTNITSPFFDKQYDLSEEIKKLEKNEYQIDSRWERVEGYILRDPKNRMRMEITTQHKGKYSLSYFLPLKENAVLIIIKTGRMHQIRAGLKSLGMVIEGDRLYGDTRSSGDKIELKQIVLGIHMPSGRKRIWRLV